MSGEPVKTAEATTLHYAHGPAYGPDEPMEAETTTTRAATFMNDAFTWTVLAICLAGWAAIGLFLWIPRVLREVGVFLVSLVQTTVTETGAEKAGRRLRSAANFYWRGFESAVRSVRAARGQETASEKAEDARIDTRIILGELAWALFVWYLILWAVGFPQITPVDLVMGIVNAPWAEMWSNLVNTFAGLPTLIGS